MESPTLSRSPSATFAPNRGRRSHTNVHHLSLAPLTPKYPIDPADYDAYFDPQTAQLHSSTSLTQISGLPSPGGILSTSPAHSRTNSRANSRAASRRRKNKSSVSIRAPHDVPSGAVSSEGLGERRSSKSNPDAGWLVQTGLTLTEGSRESKGQSWITKRDSSTSLHTADEHPRSGKATPRSRSFRRSKKSLSMTPAVVSSPDLVEPMWADGQAEEDGYGSDEFEDAYGELDPHNNEENESDDEEEVRKAISGYKLGRWMDNWVDVMLKLEDEASDEADAQHSDVEVEAPPKNPPRVWDDVAWFGRLVARTITS